MNCAPATAAHRTRQSAPCGSHSCSRSQVYKLRRYPFLLACTSGPAFAVRWSQVPGQWPASGASQVLPNTARAAAYDEGEVALCHQVICPSSVAGPGHRGGCGRSPEWPRWRSWPAWWSPGPGRTTPPVPRRRGRRRPAHRWFPGRAHRRRGLRPGGLRPRGRADRPSTCRRSAWPGSTPMFTAGAGRWHRAAAGHPRRRRLRAAAGAARAQPAGHQPGRRAGRRLRLRHAMLQFHRLRAGLPDHGWRRAPAAHHCGRLARRPPPCVGGDLPGTPYGAHFAGRGPRGHVHIEHRPGRRHGSRVGGGGLPPTGGPARHRRTPRPGYPARCCAASAGAPRWAPPATSCW